jgi:hypothetical protein
VCVLQAKLRSFDFDFDFDFYFDFMHLLLVAVQVLAVAHRQSMPLPRALFSCTNKSLGRGLAHANSAPDPCP